MRLPFQLSIRKCSVPFLLPPSPLPVPPRRHRPDAPPSPRSAAIPPTHRHAAAPPSPVTPPPPQPPPSPRHDTIPLPRRHPSHAAPRSPRRAAIPPQCVPLPALFPPQLPPPQRSPLTCAPLMMFARQVTAQMGPHVRRSRLRKSRPRSVTTGSCGCYRTCRRTCIIHVFELGGGVFSI